MIVAGTGHRPNKLGVGAYAGYHRLVQRRLIDLARAALLREHARAPVQAVVSGMALGWDMALAEAALELNIPLWAYVPFIGQEQTWPHLSQLRYLDLCSRADAFFVCCPGAYAPWKMQARNERMVNMLTDEDRLLALWDGTAGGTWNCLAYAERRGVDLHNLWIPWLRGTAALRGP
jgi:uncharacterized phage-like protein YoqJ